MEAMEAGALVAEKYLLVRQIGRGGMGAVWAARNVRTEREVALKLITDENEDYRARLLREARACGRITHRNVIEIYDVGETASGAPFLVMPLLEGEPLSRKLRRDGAMPPPIAAQIASEIARALAAAHTAGIVHRDLKPANVYLHREPGAETIVVKVLDFGISKVVTTDSTTTTTGTILGSPAYMSPEQAKGERYVDQRSDLWSLGVTLFEMLTGRRPFQGESMFTVVAAVLGGPIPHVLQYAPHIDPGLADVAARCMTRELEARVQSADEIAYLLRPYAAGYLPADLSAFAASGFHPAASFSQMPTGPHMADSASVPPVHFAPPRGVPAGAATIPSAPPRGSFPSISLHTGSISGAQGVGAVTPGVGAVTPGAGLNGPEPFSGSTTAAGSMVQGVPGALRTPTPQAYPAISMAPPPPSRTLLLLVGALAFVAVMVLAGVVIGLSSDGPPATAAGPGDGPAGAAGTAGTASAPVVTEAPTGAVAAPGTATGAETPPAATASAAAGAGAGAQTGTQAGTGTQTGTGAGAQTGTQAGTGTQGRPASTGGKTAPTSTGKPPRPNGTGVTVPDDPG